MNLESLFCCAFCTAGVKTAKSCPFTGRELEVTHVLVGVSRRCSNRPVISLANTKHPQASSPAHLRFQGRNMAVTSELFVTRFPPLSQPWMECSPSPRWQPELILMFSSGYRGWISLSSNASIFPGPGECALVNSG